MVDPTIDVFCVHTHGGTCAACNKPFDIGRDHACVFRDGAEQEEAICESCWKLIARSSFVGIRTAQEFLGPGKVSDSDVEGLLVALTAIYREIETN